MNQELTNNPFNPLTPPKVFDEIKDDFDKKWDSIRDSIYMFYLDSIIFISYVLIVIKFAAESYS